MSMEINLYLLLSLLIALLVISYLLGKLHRVRGQLFLIRDALNDICLLYTSDAADEL